MKRLFIWYHRRRAVAHKANAASDKACGDYPTMHKRLVYADWHLAQIERLEANKADKNALHSLEREVE